MSATDEKTTLDARTLSFFDQQVPVLISEKYGMDEIAAVRAFVGSETYCMLADRSLEIYRLSPLAVFSLWESEMVTGDPRNSAYIRCY